MNGKKAFAVRLFRNRNTYDIVLKIGLLLDGVSVIDKDDWSESWNKDYSAFVVDFNELYFCG